MRTTQRKGDIGVAKAIARFTEMGYDVLIPLAESASYDIVVDANGELKRVQVRFATNKEVDLRNIHSNSKGYVVKKTNENAYDWLFIVDGKGLEYLVKRCFPGRRSFTPSEKDRVH